MAEDFSGRMQQLGVNHRLDPTSSSYQEMIGQVPNYLRIGTIKLWSGQGVPSATLGGNGDYFFRSDGTAGAHAYFKTGGAWGAIA